MEQTKETTTLGMSNGFQIELKNMAEELRRILKDFVFDEYIKGNLLKLNMADIKKIENDLGYVFFAIEDLENSITLDEYKKLISTCSKQLKSVMQEK